MAAALVVLAAVSLVAVVSPEVAAVSAAAGPQEVGNFSRQYIMKRITFSDDDKLAIKEAVAALEKESSGEIVIYFAKNSHSYIVSSWKLAGMFGGLSLLVVIAMSYMWLLPAMFTPIVVSLTGLLMMGLGFTLGAMFPRMRLSVVPGEVMEQAVVTKARDVFLQEEIFNTIDRTGVLIFISELEHEVVVLGDGGINAKIPDHAWQDLVNSILRGFKKGTPAQGIIEAVNHCKTLLLENGFVVREDDTNELTDDIRIEE